MPIEMILRNIFRNKRRTLIIMTAVVVGVFSMIFLGALSRGITHEMLRNNISAFTGVLKIMHPAFRSDPSVDNRIIEPDVVEKALDRVLPPESLWTSRIRVNAAVGNAGHNAGATLYGVDFPVERKMTFLKNGLIQGHFPEPGDNRGIVVGKALLEKFETETGKKLIIMTRNVRNEIVSRAFRIRGVFEAEFEAHEKQFIFIDKLSAAAMLGTGAAVSEFSVITPEKANMESIKKKLAAILPENDFMVLSWKEMLPAVKAYLDLFDGYLMIWNIVVFIAMGFGIVNTILTAVFERMREFGLMKALGMTSGRIISGVLMESFLILFMGAIMGNLISLISILLVGTTGLDLSSFAKGAEFAGMSRMVYPVLEMKDVAFANVLVMVTGTAVCLYPAVKAARFTPVEAMRKM